MSPLDYGGLSIPIVGRDIPRRSATTIDAIQTVVGPDVKVMPVVKADAYRHGAVEVSRVLVDRGAQWLAVSNVEEGVMLRQAGVTARILVMADFLPAGRAAMLEHQLTPVIHSLEDLRELDELVRQRGGMPIDYHLKIDSGMGRLGTRAAAGRDCCGNPRELRA